MTTVAAIPVAEPTKRCTRCGHERPHSHFWRDRRNKDGLQRWCIPCLKQYPNRDEASRNYEARHVRPHVAGGGARPRIPRELSTQHSEPGTPR